PPGVRAAHGPANRSDQFGRLLGDHFGRPQCDQFGRLHRDHLARLVTRRYRDSAHSDWRILLFVRHKPEDARGFTSPYLFLGRVRYVSHESEKPMRITWRLDTEMPLDFFSEVKIAAG
ncbi:MAG TPA: hypothetical protein VFQ53_41265, partial [Kofleriaceae bacterium]|nr:hypothetical protein [Kofleriaceae bacterium]